MGTFCLTMLLALVSASPAQGADAPDPVAVLVQAIGKVQVQRAQQRTEPAALGTRLMSGDRLLVPTGGRAVVLFSNGRMITTTKTLPVQAPAGTDRSGMFQQTLRTLNEISKTNVRANPNRQGMIRPVAGAAVPISPRNGVTVLEPWPTFSWFHVPGAEGYEIQLRSEAGHLQRFVAPGRDTVWRVPVGEPVLMRGVIYEWVVAAAGDGRASEAQKFRVASRQEAEQVEQQLNALGARNPRAPGQAFLRALILRSAGMPYDALQALEQSTGAAKSSEPGALVRRLRAELLNAVGRVDEAQREAELADAVG